MIRYCVDCPEIKLVYTGTSVMTCPPKFIHKCPKCHREYRYHEVLNKSP